MTLNSRFDRKNTSLLYLVIPLFLFCFTLAAQQRNYNTELELRFESFTTQDGLAQSTVFDILQDKYGFIWMGTEQGLNRFDGYEFTVVSYDLENPNSLNNTFVTALHEDKNGVLWIGTNGGGVNRYDQRSGKITHHLVDPKTRDSFSNDVTVIYETRSGKMLIGTEGGGVKEFHRRQNKFSDFTPASSHSNTLPHKIIREIIQDNTGAVWMATEGGLKQLDLVNRLIKNVAINADKPISPSDLRIMCLYEDRDGVLWVGSWDGLYRFHRAANRFTHFNIPSKTEHFTSANKLLSMHEDRFGTFWIGSEYGLHIFDRKSHKFKSYLKSMNVRFGLSSNTINCFFEDRSGALWMGLHGGLGKVNLTGRSFKHYFSNPVHPEKVSDNGVFALYEDGDGLLWISTFGDGLNVFNRSTGELKNYRSDPQDPHTLSGDKIWAIFEDSKRHVWIGTSTEGLNRFSRETNRFTRFQYDPQNPDSLSNNVISSIIEDRKGRLWIATNKGLNRFVWETEKFIHYQSNPNNSNSLVNNVIYIIQEDRHGSLLLGTKGGLCIFNPDTETFTSYPINMKNPNNMVYHPIFSLCEDRRGMIWLGTTGGLIEFNPQETSFRFFREEDGLPDKVINGILEDDGGQLWFSTNKGLSKYDSQTKKFQNYSKEDGLQSFEFNGGSYYKSRSGELFFGGINGYNAFFPEDIKDNPYVPPVVITNFEIFNQTVPIGEKLKGRVVLEKSILESQSVTLSPQHYVFSLEFAALNYIHSENNEYAYRMEGLEDDWNYSGKRRFVTYTHLAPGNYTFRVKASNNNGVWNERGVALKIRVLPHFWMTWWFQLSTAIFIMILVISAISFKRRLRARRKKEIADMVSSQTTALQESGEKYRSVVESAHHGIAVIQQDEIVFQNVHLADMLGYNEKQINEKQLIGFVAKEQQGVIKRLLEKFAAQQRLTGSVETVFMHKDGHPVNLEINYGHIRYKKGTALLMFFNDIGMKKLLEEERMKSARLETTRVLARGIAHDFNNILSIIVGNLGLALEDAPPGSTLHRVLKEANKASIRAVDLTRQFITMARGGDPVKKTDSVEDCIKEVVDSLLPKGNTAIKCNFYFPENLWLVHYDKGLIQQAIKNIILNSLQAMGDNGILEVSAANQRLEVGQVTNKEQENYVCISFSDNGMGIDPKDLGRVFDPYFTTKDNVTRKGLGLGLSVSDSIISRHDGSIHIDSEPGTGTTVKVYLPASKSNQ